MCLGEVLLSIHTSILLVFSSACSSSIYYISRENFFRLWKNSETFYRYSSCLVRNLAKGRAFGGPAALCFVNRINLCDQMPLLWTSLFGRRVFSFVSGCISEIVAGYVLNWYILIREHVRFLCLSQSPRLHRRYRKRLGRNPTSLALLIDVLTTEGDMWIF